MKDILISVIVPAYNIEKYISRCIDSIIAQTHTLLEIIIVDDGSTDATGHIIDKYAADDKRIVAVHKKNGGVSSARTAGIQKANGAYIGFVDGDDYIEPNMYEFLLENALKYNADISHCGYKMIFPDGHEDLYYETGHLILQSHQSGLYDLLSGEFVEPALYNKLYRKSVVDFVDSPLWDSSIRINEDLLLNYILFSNANSAVYEDKTFYHYILRQGSAATSKNMHYKITDSMRVISIICKDTENNSILHPVIYTRYLRTLIGVATQKQWKDDSKSAKRKLKTEIKDKQFYINCNSKKVRYMAYAAAYAMPAYKFVRYIYDKITGVSKKYDIS